MELEVKYQVPYMVRLKDGAECLAMLIKLNKHCGELERWKRLDNVPRKKRYVDKEDVIAIAVWKEKK